MKLHNKVGHWTAIFVIAGMPFVTFYVGVQADRSEGLFSINPLYVLSVILAMFIPALCISLTIDRRFDRLEKFLKEKELAGKSSKHSEDSEA